MTRLEELIYSLATVIVRYHDSQDIKEKLVVAVEPSVLRKKSHDRAIEIIQDTKTDYFPFLEGKIAACTKGYHVREQYLLFILNEIRFLKEQLDRKTPFEPKELQTFQEQLTQLFIDFRQLLNLKNGMMHPATENSSKGSKLKELSGLLNTRYVGGKYCNSGQLLIDEVLFVLHMTTEDSNSELKEIAGNICIEHQTQLSLQSEKLKNEAKESEFEKQKLSLLEAQKSELDSAHKLELLEKDKAHQLAMDELRSDLERIKEAPKPQLESLEKDKSSLLTIDELQKELEKTKAELQKAQEEVLSLRIRPPYLFPYSGLAGLMLNQNRGTTGAPRFFQHSLQSSQTTTTPKEESSKFNIE
ncbi:Uncharacterised protein [Legionella steigerwaltii]|uniref:Uncharacterized protein n=1 Tax=Legionella steigerwaltii TaxID=460 RepID=A0A378LHR1_9GAMM|nr:hypothetical protein [Legionella steigerwaltii]KTD79030.1 hypothetical protein Lstg_0987 [Legionella steigerwaltii]STY23621.1 Uncharacterised protein [Legionella steigerwaltii]